MSWTRRIRDILTDGDDRLPGVDPVVRGYRRDGGVPASVAGHRGGHRRAVAGDGALFSSGTVEVLLNSLLLMAGVTVFSILLGVPLAYLTARTDLPFRRFWSVVAALPLVVPSYVGAFAFVSAFGPRGEFHDVLAPLGIDRVPEIYGLPGTILVITLYTYPYVYT